MSAPHDFLESRTHDGRKFRMLNVIDEFKRECLAIRIDRKLNSTAVIDGIVPSGLEIRLRRGRADSFTKPSRRRIELIVRSATRMPKRRSTTAHRSTRRQRTTPSISGSGPASTIAASSLICSVLSMGVRLSTAE
ncbi:hypothetical protein JSE7799_02213 [Jannaschia seosinensis]|uniref:Integrase catalytic domain-containing protein n=1 Tax=Jannaschia seosinensis TaxID=313367 RepID=A0A0M7BDW3_9RHOB|nr:hypothetical protein JSE7799_02213 [Jannaschia seosinensis]